MTGRSGSGRGLEPPVDDRADLHRRVGAHAARLCLQDAGGAGRFAELVGVVEVVRYSGVTGGPLDGLPGFDGAMVVGQIVQLERATRREQGAPEDDELTQGRSQAWTEDGSGGHRIGFIRSRPAQVLLEIPEIKGSPEHEGQRELEGQVE